MCSGAPLASRSRETTMLTQVIGKRANCVFATNNDLFWLNNVHTDRITIQGWHHQRPWGLEQWVTVRSYGDDVIFEKTFEPPQDDGSELSRQMHKSSPQLFEPRHYTYVEYELHRISAGATWFS
jgi:hypothetical protein